MRVSARGLRAVQGARPPPPGFANTTNPDGQTTFNNRWKLMHSLDDNLRVNSPNGTPMDDYNDFYSSAEGMMYNPVVNQAFGYTAADSARYGSTSLGNACLVANQVLKANQGTRFIQITSNDGWDMHQNIYAAGTLPAKGKILDDAVSQLIERPERQRAALQHAGGDGRRIRPHGRPAHRRPAGRDHWPQQFAFFAGGGVKGGTVVGATNAIGLRHDRLRLVAEPLRLCRGYRGDGVLRGGNRLDHRPPRRSARPRLRIRPPDGPVPVLPRPRTVGVSALVG